jgi:hypothetical protein
VTRRCSRIVGLAAATLMAAACGASPTNPDDLFNLSMTPGEYFFRAAILSVPPNCGPGLKNDDVSMSSRVSLSREGTEWIARSSGPADGTLELRFRGSPGPVINSSAPIGGTLRGTANHKDNATSGVQRSMTIPISGASVSVTGVANDTGLIPVLGLHGFEFTFSRTANGATVTCSLAANLWSLDRK